MVFRALSRPPLLVQPDLQGPLRQKDLSPGLFQTPSSITRILRPAPNTARRQLAIQSAEVPPITYECLTDRMYQRRGPCTVLYSMILTSD